jgi:hypothetical protein
MGQVVVKNPSRHVNSYPRSHKNHTKSEEKSKRGIDLDEKGH